MSIPHGDIVDPTPFQRARAWSASAVGGRHDALEHVVLPYGLWGQEDGRAIVFNRDHDPIFMVWPDGRVLPMMGGWVRNVRREATWYFHEHPYEIFFALYAAAHETGCGSEPSRRDLIGWLRDQAVPTDAARTAEAPR